MPQIMVPLSQEEFDRLRDRAQDELRHPRDTARLLLRESLALPPRAECDRDLSGRVQPKSAKWKRPSVFRPDPTPRLPETPVNASDERGNTKGAESPPEASPLWPLVLALGRIAERVERRKAEEHKMSDEGPTVGMTVQDAR